LENFSSFPLRFLTFIVNHKSHRNVPLIAEKSIPQEEFRVFSVILVIILSVIVGDFFPVAYDNPLQAVIASSSARLCGEPIFEKRNRLILCSLQRGGKGSDRRSISISGSVVIRLKQKSHRFRQTLAFSFLTF